MVEIMENNVLSMREEEMEEAVVGLNKVYADGDNVDKSIGSGFHIRQRASCHTARSVQHEDNVCWIGRYVGSGRECKCYFQSAVTADLKSIDLFVRICNTHCITSIYC